MNFKEIIEKVISLPGYFIVFDDRGDNKKKKTNGSNHVFLDIFKEREKAEIVFSVFEKSKKNSMNLLNEAKILLENRSYARAVALAIMSYEELGKSQIAADYYSGILPESEYKKAFKKHEKTSYSSRYAAIGTHEKVKHGYFIDKDVAKTLEQIRQSALYVDENNDPSENFTDEDATLIIQKVNEHHESIMHAEWLNGRIGSKALFK
jgi:AbiV family abortive infection protein